MKKVFLFILFIPACLIIAIAGHLTYLYTHKEFKPNEFASSLVQKNFVEMPLQDEEEKDKVRSILSQRFSHFGLGKQMTAYVSDDQQYVLKLFNPRSRLKEKWFHNYKDLKFFCSLKWLSSAYFKRKERLLKVFNRHAMAFREIRDEAGLVYVHLNPSTALHQTVEVVDKDNTSYFLNLDEIPFVLQRKVELAGKRLNQLRNQNDQKGIEEALEQLRQLFFIRASKGITDRIQTLHNNYGFLGDKAIQIDVGRISFDENIQLDPDAEVKRILINLPSAP